MLFRTGPTDGHPTGVSWSRRIATANKVWTKLGVGFSPKSPIVLDDATSKTAGDDNAESTAVAATRTGAGIEVFCVDNDMKYAGGAETLPPTGVGSASDQIVMSDRGTSNTLLAHELGHVLGLFHPPTGADPKTIMEPSGGHSRPNPERNTMANYRFIRFPAPGAPICLSPDP